MNLFAHVTFLELASQVAIYFLGVLSGVGATIALQLALRRTGEDR